MVIYSAEARFWDTSKIPWQKITVPSPYDPGTPDIDTWNTYFARKALSFRKVGFGGLQYPPFLKTQSGTFNTGDGYGWNGDLDDFGTKGPTHFGLGQELLRTVGNWNACGMRFGANIVTHQAVGDPGNGEFRFKNWAGLLGAAWTKWNKGCFRDWRGEDPVWEQPDFGFGREYVYKLASPPGYTERMMIEGWQRLLKRVGFQFARLDDVKGEYLPFVRDFVKAKGLNQIRYIAEDFDGYHPALIAWLDAMGVNNVSVYDFETHWALQQIFSQSYGNLLQMNGKGLNAYRPMQSCVFADNADTDLSEGEQIISAKRRCYAWLLTVEGDVQIYHKDYSTDSECYGLQEYIDPMVWVHQVCGNGSTITRWNDASTIVLERLGENGMISAFSTDPVNAQTRKVYTKFSPGTWLRSFTGQHGDVKVQNDQSITVTIPSDYFGQGNSYLMFGPADLAGIKFDVNPTDTIQHVFGEDDRDIPPALSGKLTNLWPFWCAAGHPLQFTPQEHYPGVRLQATQPDGTLLPMEHNQGLVQKTGWHTLQAYNLNSADVPVEIAVRYRGTPELTDEQAKQPIPPLANYAA